MSPNRYALKGYPETRRGSKQALPQSRSPILFHIGIEIEIEIEIGIAIHGPYVEDLMKNTREIGA